MQHYFSTRPPAEAMYRSVPPSDYAVPLRGGPMEKL